MRNVFLAATVMAAVLASPAQAVVVNNLNIQEIPDPDVVPQSLSNPCIICATEQAHNPISFGYNNFDSTGNTSSFNLFSTNLFQALGNDIQGTPYTVGQLRNLFPNVDVSFAVAVDINTTGANSEFLRFFQLINLGLPGTGDETVIFDLRDIPLPGVNNGNGAADYLITGFNLAGLNDGDRLLFRASWSGAVDGGESFYLVPQVQLDPVPLPAAVWMFMSGIAGLGWLARRRRQAKQIA